MTPADAARSYIGVPFYHAGRDRNGIDCIGLIACVAKDLGYKFKDDRDYSPNALLPERMLAGISQFCILGDDLVYETGDVLMINPKGLIWHCAIVTGDNLMVHCQFTGKAKTVEHSIGRYAKWIHSVWRWK